jgi:chromate transporter
VHSLRGPSPRPSPRTRGEGIAPRGRRPAASEAERIGLTAIFAAFLSLGVTSFGGNTAAWLHHRIVQRRHWVTDAEFLSGLALGRIMPGSGGVNLTVQVGQRLRGGAGAAASVFGLLSGPLVIVLALAMAYTRIGWSPAVHAVLDGIAAAAIGLTFATGLRLLPRGSASLGPLAITLATVLGVGVLRWPMLPVVLCLAPISIGLAVAQLRFTR